MPAKDNDVTEMAIFGMDSESYVHLNYIKDCGCDDEAPVGFSCNNGTYQCGVCKCPPNYEGDQCNCEKDSENSQD
jgi:hypothetical protein